MSSRKPKGHKLESLSELTPELHVQSQEGARAKGKQSKFLSHSLSLSSPSLKSVSFSNKKKKKEMFNKVELQSCSEPGIEAWIQTYFDTV